MSQYVISAELERFGNVLKQEELPAFRADLTANLTALGFDVDWVPMEELKDGLRGMIETSELPVVSMDGRYVRPESVAGQIAVSRIVDLSLENAGYDARVGAPAAAKQFDEISRRFAGQEIALADDVLFSGGIVRWVARELRTRGVSVKTLLAGVAIAEGIANLESDGITVQAARVYQEVVDEICERDLAVVPGSGRTVAGQGQTALYFDPDYGRPGEWASIPANAGREFCARCLQRSLGLLPPETDIADIGSFLGYPEAGNAREAISRRIGQILDVEAIV